MTRFLVTGGAGFIGSHLVESLLAAGHEVVAFDSLATGRLSNLDAVQGNRRFEFVQASVLDDVALDSAVHRSDVVVHLAAAVGVKLIIDRPLYSFNTNIQGALKVLEAAHRYRRMVVLTSSSEIYGRNGSGPLDETADRVLGPPTVTRWAYSTSKAVNEVLGFAYHREHGLPTIVVRLFNTVGPRQSPAYGMVIPRLVHQALAGEPLTVYGDGTQTRCFCHVADVVDAFMRLIDEPRAIGDVFNVGSTEEVTIDELARRVLGATKSRSVVEHLAYDVAYETGFEDMLRRVPDVTKIEALTGWRAKRSLAEILDDVVAEVRSVTRR